MKPVHFFDEGGAGGERLLGGRGARLCEMASLGLPVPPGFVVTADVCSEYCENGRRMPPGAMEQVRQAVSRLEKETGRGWNSADNPLLVSVGPGAAGPVPGAAGPVLCLGLNDRTARGLAKADGADERLAWDSYRRFVQTFGVAVLGIDDSRFKEAMDGAEGGEGSGPDGGPIINVVHMHAHFYVGLHTSSELLNFTHASIQLFPL